MEDKDLNIVGVACFYSNSVATKCVTMTTKMYYLVSVLWSAKSGYK